MNAYDSIMTYPELATAFVEATNLIKTKALPARNVTMQFLQLFEANQYSNPDFVLELHEFLTVPKQRNFMMAGIKGK